MQTANQAVRSHSALIDPARIQLGRILDSIEFAKSPRHREFLAYLVDRELRHPGTSSKEVVIAIDVFKRDITTFDARLDPIVRIEAGRLRGRLQSYYAKAGVEDVVRFEIPKGCYALRFRFNQRAQDASVAQPLAIAGRIDLGVVRLASANDNVPFAWTVTEKARD